MLSGFAQKMRPLPCRRGLAHQPKLEGVQHKTLILSSEVTEVQYGKRQDSDSTLLLEKRASDERGPECQYFKKHNDMPETNCPNQSAVKHVGSAEAPVPHDLYAALVD
jgi:hypothetical protein